MKSTQNIQRPANWLKRMVKWPLLCGLLSLTAAQYASAAMSTYNNDTVVNYPVNVPNPPVIDATNFVNNSQFIINFTTFDITQPFYETSDTLNYTNSNAGLMMANTGFRFDTQLSGNNQTNRLQAGNFVNYGIVSCGSTNNTGDPYFGLLGTYFGLFGSFGYSQCLINASNVLNPGQLTAGLDGIIQIQSQNVDLSHGTLNIEGESAFLENILGNSLNVGTFGSGGFGVDTNGDWNPGTDLGTDYALSSYPFYLDLTNSTAFMTQDDLGNGTLVTRAVFIQDDSGPGVGYNVYFNAGSPDYSVIEWTGSYLDAASGQYITNYLYMGNDYVLGAGTNVALINGYPDNFSFVSSPTRLIFQTPASSGFFPIFPDGSITNPYSYASIQLLAATVNTNQIPNGALTNLPGRIEINATSELNLGAAQIYGPNYLSIQSPHQFDGSPGAFIQAPFADLTLGVTNGFLTVSNLLSPGIPTWSGNVQAWSTRWIVSDSTSTNDYRVLIVGSALNPQTLARVQDLILHATNSIVISDSLNVMRTFTADAQNLTLTTNEIGNGATSPDGELNIGTVNAFSWQQSLPNLRNLTNNGALRFQNFVQFYGNSNVVSVTPGTNAVAATGTLSEVAGRTNVKAGNFVQIGTNGYSFVSKLTNSIPNRVLIASTFDGTMSNLIAAINGSSGAGTKYSTNTVANPVVTAGPLDNHAFTVTATTAGTSGNTNYVSLSISTTNLLWSGIMTNSPTSGYLFGGIDYVAPVTNIISATSFPYDNFINGGLVADQGSTIWAKNFESSGVVSNGVGAFNLTAQTGAFTNGLLVAGGDVSISASDLEVSNVVIQAGHSLVLNVTNSLTDDGVTNGNVWSVQGSSTTGGNGLMLPVLPVQSSLLGTTIANDVAGPNQQTINVWAGTNYGATAAGYTNNAAVGQLILNAQGANSLFKFYGAGVNNALYVDNLELQGNLTNGVNNSYDFGQNLFINNNLVIYFAQATVNGVSVAEKIDSASKSGRNSGGRLRWVPGYAGHFSSVDVIYPDGSTNLVNAALAASTTIDSDGDGVANAYDPTPFFASSNVQLGIAETNAIPPSILIQWNSIPGATNSLLYSTNLAAGWTVFTNIVSSSVVPPMNGWPITNILALPVTNNASGVLFYRVKIDPNSALLYGN